MWSDQRTHVQIYTPFGFVNRDAQQSKARNGWTRGLLIHTTALFVPYADILITATPVPLPRRHQRSAQPGSGYDTAGRRAADAIGGPSWSEGRVTARCQYCTSAAPGNGPEGK